jgi:hypothetical protein
MAQITSSVDHKPGSQASRLDWVLKHAPADGISLTDLAGQARTPIERARNHLGGDLKRSGTERLASGKYRLTGSCGISGASRP